MSLRGFRTIASCTLVAACGVLTLVSCGHSPTAPGGQLLVYVSECGAGPLAGKTIKIVGTSLVQTTDAHGLALFSLPAGSHVVRAYDINTGGLPPPYVEQSVTVASAQIAEVGFCDCTKCV